ncbi:hypothetical protein GQ457_12G014230 [Hibiscus cannabinus]
MSQQWYQSHLYNLETESKNEECPEKAIAHGEGRLHKGGGYMLPCRASFLHVEPSRLKLGFLAILLAWDGPP